MNKDKANTSSQHNAHSMIARATSDCALQWARLAVRVSAALSPPLAVRLAHTLFFTPQRLFVRPKQRTLLADGHQATLIVQKQPIVYWTWGTGPIVGLVHGWGAHAGTMTPLVAPLVAAGFRVVAWDMPAHGASGGRRSSIVQWAAVLRHSADRFGPLYGVVAHSLGTAAVTYALGRGLSVQRVVFFAPPAYLAPLWERVRTQLDVPPHIWQRMVVYAEHRLGVPFPNLEPLLLAPHLHTPLLVIHDADDREIPIGDAIALVEHWPHALLHRTVGFGHRRIVRDGASIAAAVAFLHAVSISP